MLVLFTVIKFSVSFHNRFSAFKLSCFDKKLFNIITILLLIIHTEYINGMSLYRFCVGSLKLLNLGVTLNSYTKVSAGECSQAQHDNISNLELFT